MMVKAESGIEAGTVVKLSLRDVAGISAFLGAILIAIGGVYLAIDRRASQIEYRVETLQETMAETKKDRAEIHDHINRIIRQVDRIAGKQVDEQGAEAKSPKNGT